MAQQSSASGSAGATFEDGSQLSVQFRRVNNDTSATISYDHDADTSTAPRRVEYTNGSAVWVDENGRRAPLPANIAEEALAAVRGVAHNGRNEMSDLRSIANFATDPVNNRTRWAR